jgi:uncharacterized protein YbaA (DUF1428 family)
LNAQGNASALAMLRLATSTRRHQLRAIDSTSKADTRGTLQRGGLTTKTPGIAMTYIDGFVAAVPTVNREKFKTHAEEAADVFKENGALNVVECWGDDVPEGQVTSFPMAVKRKPDETVVFSWIVWPSREVRDKGMKALMTDPRMQPDTKPMPFDGRRMIFGGFVPIVEK